MLNRTRLCQIAFLLGSLLSMLPATDARWWKTLGRMARRKHRKTAAVEDVYIRPDHSQDIPGVPFLIEALGKEIYAGVNQQKYKSWIHVASGRHLSDESTFVTGLNFFCNLLYVVLTLAGFILLPRGFMLVTTPVTMLVGPALVLVMLVMTSLLLIAFGMYPIISVTTIWTIFFLATYLAQNESPSLDQFPVDVIDEQASRQRSVAADSDKTSATGSQEHEYDDDSDGQWIPLNIERG